MKRPPKSTHGEKRAELRAESGRGRCGGGEIGEEERRRLLKRLVVVVVVEEEEDADAAGWPLTDWPSTSGGVGDTSAWETAFSKYKY